MDISLCKVDMKDTVILERLFQLFEYDTSSLSGMDIGEDGLYHRLNDISDYTTKENYYSCFIKVDGKLAGIVVIRFEECETYLRHFFILKKYRRQKIGSESAYKIFDKFSGRWRVSTNDFNKPAIEFWEKVCETYTNGNYKKLRRPDNRGPQFEFDCRSKR